MLYYRGYKIGIRVCEMDGVKITRSSESFAEALSEFDPSKERAFKFVVFDDEDFDCREPVPGFDHYDTIDEAIDAINNVWDGTLDLMEVAPQFYALTLSSGEKICMLAVDVPDILGAEIFVRDMLEEGEHVINIRAINDDEADEIYGMTRDDEGEPFCKISAYELTLSSGDYACMLGTNEPSIEEAEEFISDILNECEHVVHIDEISLECAEDNYGLCSDNIEVFEGYCYEDNDDCEWCDDCEGDCDSCPHSVDE